MKKQQLFLYLFTSVLLFAGQLQAQWPLQEGLSANTCMAPLDANGDLTNDFVLGVVDVRAYEAATPDANWAAPMYHDPDWISSRLGQVFGVAINETSGDIYVTATTCYTNDTNDPLAFGINGAGGIYRIHGVTGDVIPFASLPNNGSGLGNIAYDHENGQLFVTNHHDGLIYRLALNGTVLQTFDFGGSVTFAGTDTDDFVALGERLWGIAVHEGRVYFSVWNEDSGSGRNSNVVENEIWSVALAGGAMSGAAMLELSMPQYGITIWSNPVSDIAFNCEGKMMVAERSMTDNMDPWAHDSRVLEFEHNGTNWVQTAFFHFGYPYGDNAAGGVDYGYAGYDSVTQDLPHCDSMHWFTADAYQIMPFGFPVIYGLAGEVNDAAPTYYVDFDGDLTNVAKRGIGDTEIMGICACDTCSLDFEFAHCCATVGNWGTATGCDLCDTTANPDGGFYVWLTDGNGTIIFDPPYSFEWVDDQDNVIGTGPAILVTVNETYCVTVTDPDGCTWSECFYQQCCDSIEIEIEHCVPQGCDPCEKPEDSFPVSVLANGSVLTNPPYTFIWTDENGTVVSTAASANIFVNMWYYVQVTDSNDCVFEDSIYYECCEELEVEIETCFSDPTVSSKKPSKKLLDEMKAYKLKYKSLAKLPANDCDPCDFPNDQFFAWATDANGNELTDPPYTFEWTDANGNVISTYPYAPLMVEEWYYLTVTDEFGCEHTASFYWDCCELTTPTGMGCVLRNGQPVLDWDVVPDAGTYNLQIMPYMSVPDACCPQPQGMIGYFVNGLVNSHYPANSVNYTCFWWRVIPVCPNGETGPPSPWQCFNKNTMCSAPNGGGGGATIGKREGTVISFEIDAWEIFPNPTSQKLNLRSPFIKQGMLVNVYDQLGRKVKTVQSTTDVEMSLSLGEMNDGIYFLQIKSSTGEILHAAKVRLVK